MADRIIATKRNWRQKWGATWEEFQKTTYSMYNESGFVKELDSKEGLEKASKFVKNGKDVTKEEFLAD